MAPMEIGRPDSRFADIELADRLKKVMATLAPRARVVLAAHYLRGVQYDDLAAALEVPIGTVKTLIHRAKRELRERLSAGGL